MRMLIGLVFVHVLATAGVSADTARPNIVVILADDQGYGDVGCYGATGFTTPNLDAMAAGGVRFTDFYVPAPVCTPTRAGLLTGCYPMRLGLGYRVLFPFSNRGLNPNETTLAELLQGAGYATAIIGKWHLGHHSPFLPLRQGFDTFFGTPYSNDMDSAYYKHLDYVSSPLPLMRNDVVEELGPDQRLLTRRYTEAAIDYIHTHKDKPFFLYLAHNMPHVPIYVSDAFAGKTSQGLYGDAIAEIDWSVGEINRALEAAGIAENTLVIFTSDNGPAAGPRKGPDGQPYEPGSAGPLRGFKGSTWEGGMREPCIMRWPARIPEGSTVREMATAMDILPTIAGLAGLLVPEAKIDGKDILPLITGVVGAKSPYDVFYYYRDNRLEALRSGPWKLHLYKPEWEGRKQRPMLFNLTEDQGESQNVAEAHPEIVASLLEKAEAARTELGDALTGAAGAGVRPYGVFGSERLGDDAHRYPLTP